MKHLTRWILALLAIAAVASLSGAWTSQEKPKKDPQVEKINKSKRPQPKSRALKQAAILKHLPTLKVTLVEAIQLAEKEAGGKAVSADLDVTEDKPVIQINLVVGDKFTVAKLDPFTKKVTVVSKKAVGEDDEDDEEEAEEGDEGG